MTSLPFETFPTQLSNSTVPRKSGRDYSRLYEVITQTRFETFFQPIVRTADRTCFALESLIRCDIPDFESPKTVFESATQFGLAQQVSQLARERAIESLGSRHENQRLFLNTHPDEELDSELIASLRTLKQSSPGRKLVLEVHESTVLDLNRMREFRFELHAQGIQLAYDDFGAGEGRISELIAAPPDFLKFDRSILNDIHLASERQQNVVETLVKIVRSEGISTLAEGIDNEDALEVCRQMGFVYCQGYLTGRPQSIEDLIVRVVALKS